MKLTKVKTGSPYEEKLSYSRAIALGDWILVSNTAGRNYATREIADNAADQTRRALHNISGALAALDAALKDVVRIRISVPNPADVTAVGEIIGEAFKGADPVLTITCTPLAGPEYLVELEVTACRGSSKAEIEMLSVTL